MHSLPHAFLIHFVICAPFVPRMLILPMRKPMEQQLELHLCEHVTSAWPLRPTPTSCVSLFNPRPQRQENARTSGPQGAFTSPKIAPRQMEKLPWISLNNIEYPYNSIIFYIDIESPPFSWGVRGTYTQNVQFWPRGKTRGGRLTPPVTRVLYNSFSDVLGVSPLPKTLHER